MSKPEDTENHSEEPRDKITPGCWKRPAYHERPKQRSMSLRQGKRKTETEMSNEEVSAEYLNGKQRREVALEENEASGTRCCNGSHLESFHLRHEATSNSDMVNQEKGPQGKKPVPAPMVIRISAAAMAPQQRHHSSSSSGSTRMMMVVGRTITAISTSGASERIPWVVWR